MHTHKSVYIKTFKIAPTCFDHAIAKKQKHQQYPTTIPHNKKWVTFIYFSPIIRRITNLFKHPNLNIAFRVTNTIQQQLTEKPTNKNPSGIYKLKCNTCNNVYVGQSGRSIDVRHKEHIRYIRNNNPLSAYALHILQNGHVYGTTADTDTCAFLTCFQ